VIDMHPERVAQGAVPPVRSADGRPGRLSAHRHSIGDYLRAALPVGLQVRRRAVLLSSGATSVHIRRYDEQT